MTQPVRIEHDLLGDRAVPADAYYGIHTLRALENFSITGTPISHYPDLVNALACVKQAAAIANSELGLLEEKRAVAVRLACAELREGKLHEEFVVDVIQGGAGTSIMPGKVNPVIPEVVNQIAFEVIGNDMTVTMAAEAGQLQLNAFEPIIAHSLFEGIQHLTAGCRTLNERCVKGITANVERARRLLDESTALVTALTPILGYARSAEIARDALATGARVYDLVLSKGWMTREQLDEVLKPEVLTKPHYSTIHKQRA
jgi:aspartate ammonia-lyase